MSWQPLLNDALAERARDSVHAVVADLTSLGGDFPDNASLAGGMAGQAILHGYLARAGCGHDPAASAERCLREATAAMTATATMASLYAGLTGVGWALAHLTGDATECHPERARSPRREPRACGEPPDNPPPPLACAAGSGGVLPDLHGIRDVSLSPSDSEADLTEIDEVLLEHLDQSPWADDYDLINGLVGFGVYALERLPRPAAIACLERVIAHLEMTAERRPEGLRWWTNPDWLPEETRVKYPRGYWNLGLAHGVPGVIAFLGRVCEAGGAVDRARELLDGAVGWALAQDAATGFPYWIAPDLPADDRSRLAWCYGDPGVAAALLGAARCVKEPAWERQAIAIARRAAARPHDQSGVVDAGLCHGAAGLAHLFNRMFQATGEVDLGSAARSWFERTLEMRRPGRGIGGYEARMGGDDSKPSWVADPGLLTGATGIALALLAAVTAVEPAWDRMLLVDIPPTARQP